MNSDNKHCVSTQTLVFATTLVFFAGALSAISIFGLNISFDLGENSGSKADWVAAIAGVFAATFTLFVGISAGRIASQGNILKLRDRRQQLLKDARNEAMQISSAYLVASSTRKMIDLVAYYFERENIAKLDLEGTVGPINELIKPLSEVVWNSDQRMAVGIEIDDLMSEAETQAKKAHLYITNLLDDPKSGLDRMPYRAQRLNELMTIIVPLLAALEKVVQETDVVRKAKEGQIDAIQERINADIAADLS
ncbi:MAG: hypothetical protein DI584_03150 [Stenotrophomonas sp.]|nr:MAG: hypothetical protein DI584_03150 [Stenotrophomonas sp.]